MEKLSKIKGEKTGMDWPAKNARILPTIRLSSDDLADVKDWKVGDKCRLVIECEVISTRQGNEWDSTNPDKRTHSVLKVTEVGKDEEEEDYQTEYAKRMSKR